MPTGVKQTIYNSSAATGTSDEIEVPPGRAGFVRFQIQIASAGTVVIQHTLDGTNWHTLRVLDESQATETSVVSVTASKIVTAEAFGSTKLRASVSGVSGGAVVITASKAA